MRVTKKTLAESKRAIQGRITELCAIMATGGLAAEWKRAYPYATPFKGTNAEMLQLMILDALDQAIPDHWLS